MLKMLLDTRNLARLILIALSLLVVFALSVLLQGPVEKKEVSEKAPGVVEQPAHAAQPDSWFLPTARRDTLQPKLDSFVFSPPPLKCPTIFKRDSTAHAKESQAR